MTDLEPRRPVLLIVDDSIAHQRHYRIRIVTCEILQAHSFEEFFAVFADHKDRITHVIMDGNLPLATLKRRQNPEEVGWGKGTRLAAHAREAGFRGPIAAFSTDPLEQAALMACGCTLKIEKTADPSFSRQAILDFLSTPVP